MQPERDLAEPVFYFSPLAGEQRVLDRINRAIGKCPAIAHGAEEDGSRFERMFYSVLHALGAAPPYWRFLSTFLSMPPLPALRARGTGVAASRPDPTNSLSQTENAGPVPARKNHVQSVLLKSSVAAAMASRVKQPRKARSCQIAKRPVFFRMSCLKPCTA